MYSHKLENNDKSLKENDRKLDKERYWNYLGDIQICSVPKAMTAVCHIKIYRERTKISKQLKDFILALRDFRIYLFNIGINKHVEVNFIELCWENHVQQ